MISLLLPTRQRPNELLELYDSAFGTAARPAEVEMVAVVDDDDRSYDALGGIPQLQLLSVPRTTLSDYWNIASRFAKGPVYGLLADDVRFRTQGWDEVVAEAFPPDGIAHVFGDDGTPYYPNHDYGTHGFIRQEWLDAAGTFTTPDFSKDYADSWLNVLGIALGRQVWVPILMEHLHFSLTGRMDENTRERLERGERDQVIAKWESPEQVAKRDAAIGRLRSACG